MSSHKEPRDTRSRAGSLGDAWILRSRARVTSAEPSGWESSSLSPACRFSRAQSSSFTQCVPSPDTGVGPVGILLIIHLPFLVLAPGWCEFSRGGWRRREPTMNREHGRGLEHVVLALVLTLCLVSGEHWFRGPLSLLGTPTLSPSLLSSFSHVSDTKSSP